MNPKPARIFAVAALILGLIIRAKALWAPIAGDFASYQMDNLWMTKFMLKEGWHAVLYPKSMTLANGQPSLILLSFPLGSLITALLAKITGGSIEVLGHVQVTLFSMLTAAVFFCAVRRLFGSFHAWTALGILWLSPLFMIYGSKFFAEPLAAFFLTCGFYFASRSAFDTAPRLSDWFLAGLTAGIAFILRAHFFLTFPAFLYLLWPEKGKNLSAGAAAAFFLPAVLPFMLWFYHAGHASALSDNIFVNYGFADQARDRLLDWRSSVRLLAASHVQKTLLNDFTDLHFTPALLPFLLTGFCVGEGKAAGFVRVWYATFFLVILLLPQKIYDHPFYAFAVLPAGALLISRGLETLFLSPQKDFYRKTAAWLLASAFVFFSLRFSLPPLFAQAPDQARGVAAGKYLSKVLPRDAKIVSAHAGSSPEFFYYTDRPGWIFDFTKRSVLETGGIDVQRQYYSALFQKKKESFLKMSEIERLEQYRREGAAYFAVLDPEELSQNTEFAGYLMGHFKPVESKRRDVRIFDLRS